MYPFSSQSLSVYQMEAHNEFTPEWIWPDDEGMNVYAQEYGQDLTVILSFSASKHNPPTSLANRVCTKYERLDTADPASTFSTTQDMHNTV
uniref:Uncharacterized protein n=1 Tax=Bionectria ochroleuca TaxID=29856 RepID=A0A8H7NLT6_BIOOC